MALRGTCPPCARGVEVVVEEEVGVVVEEVGEEEVAEMRMEPWMKIEGKRGAAVHDLLRKGVP